MKDKKMLYGIGIVFLFLATVGFSYAYFTASIANKDVKDQVVETGTLSLRYVDGPEINMQNIKPGSTITKTVYVANTGTLDASYNLVWQELVNEIANDEMVIEASCTRMNGQTEEVDGTCEGLDETSIKRIIIKENVSIEPSIVHKYDITITFKEMNKDQNYNQNKKFTGVLGVKEYKAPETVYCTFDGDMVQGAEYVNGQYTYRYMQEGKYSASGLGWNNVSSDEWGVQLTDKTSSEPVTSKLCTYINNKPVVSMAYMFANTNASSIDFSNFNTSNIVDMSYMFYRNNTKTLDLSSFDTSNVTKMHHMFSDSRATTLDLSDFNTSKVIFMNNMFSDSQASSINLSSFDTTNVIYMNSMFSNSQAESLNLNNFDTSNVVDMSFMFGGSMASTVDISSFDTKNVENMKRMFASSNIETLDLSVLDTSNVTNMSGMFWGTKLQSLDLRNFNTSKVIDMSYMFFESQVKTLNLSSFDTSNVTNMNSTFSFSQVPIIDLNNFDTSKVTDMGEMFRQSKFSSLDLSNFDTSNVTSMNHMFYYCPNLKTIYVGNKFITSNVSNDTYMFDGSSNLVGGAGTKFSSNHVDKTYARNDGGSDSPGYFTLKSN